MNESPCFAELLLDGLVPDAFSFDVDRQAFGDKAHFTMQSFGQHAAVAFDLLKPVIDSLVDLHKLPVNRLKALVYRLESPVVPVQSLLNPTKPRIEILNQFLIHTASVAV